MSQLFEQQQPSVFLSLQTTSHALCFCKAREEQAGWIFSQGFPGSGALEQDGVTYLSRVLSFKLSTSRGQGSSWFMQTWK